MSKKVAAVAMDDKSAAAITCPHCGAPVKYAAADMDDADASMDDAGGDADALEELDDAAGGEGLEEMDDAGGELAEPSTDADDDGDASTDATADSTGLDADEAALDDVAADDVAADDGDAALDDDVAADDGVAAAGVAKPNQVAPKPGAVVAKKMAGVKVPKPAPKIGPGQGAAPPPAAPQMDEASLAEMRRLSERLAKYERQQEVDARKMQVRQGRALLSRGLREGKLTPRMIGTPQKPTETRRFAMRDPKGFSRWLAKEAPIVVEFRERGTTQAEAPDSAASTAAIVDTQAKALQAKDSSLDYKTATLKVLESNRSLSERYDREMSGAGPREVSAISRDSAVSNRTASK